MREEGVENHKLTLLYRSPNPERMDSLKRGGKFLTRAKLNESAILSKKEFNIDFCR